MQIPFGDAMKRFIPLVLSFIISLMVFLMPWGFSFYPKEEVQEAENTVMIPPKKEFLLMIEEKEEPILFLHTELTLNNAKIRFLPPSYKAKDTDGLLPLYDISKNGGLKYAVRALNKSPSFNIELFASADTKTVRNILKIFGSCDFTLDLDIKGRQDEIFFKKGRTLLNGENALLILEAAAFPPLLKRQEIFTCAVCSLLNQRGEISPAQREFIFTSLANGRESSLSAKDMLNFRKYKIFTEGFTFTLS